MFQSGIDAIDLLRRQSVSVLPVAFLGIDKPFETAELILGKNDADCIEGFSDRIGGACFQVFKPDGTVIGFRQLLQVSLYNAEHAVINRNGLFESRGVASCTKTVSFAFDPPHSDGGWYYRGGIPVHMNEFSFGEQFF